MGGKVQRGFAVALGRSDHFQNEEVEVGLNWQRRTGILRKRMSLPETESKSFVFPVTLLTISTFCTFPFPGRVGLDVVTELPPCKRFVSQSGVGKERNYFVLISQKHKPPFASALTLFSFCKHEWPCFWHKAAGVQISTTGVTFARLNPHPSSTPKEMPAVP